MAHLRYLTDKSRIVTVSEAEEPLEDIIDFVLIRSMEAWMINGKED